MLVLGFQVGDDETDEAAASLGEWRYSLASWKGAKAIQGQGQGGWSHCGSWGLVDLGAWTGPLYSHGP